MGHLVDRRRRGAGPRPKRAGYRHIDTAQAYENERGVGEGLRTSGMSRGQIFVTTKLVAECKNFAEARIRIDGSLKALSLDHIDLMLIHSPQPWSKFRNGEHFLEGNLNPPCSARAATSRAPCRTRTITTASSSGR